MIFLPSRVAGYSKSYLPFSAKSIVVQLFQKLKSTTKLSEHVIQTDVVVIGGGHAGCEAAAAAARTGMKVHRANERTSILRSHFYF